MKKYFTLPGTRYYLGKDFIHPGMKVHLYKEPENAYDKEAIRVECEGLGKGRVCCQQCIYRDLGKSECRKTV